MKYIFLMLFSLALAFAQTKNQETYNPNVDCLILEDENSIVCKFEVEIDTNNEQTITINWIDPDGELSRTREMIVPAGDSSVYDFRYLNGRKKGNWNFVVIYKGKEYSTKFELK